MSAARSGRRMDRRLLGLLAAVATGCGLAEGGLLESSPDAGGGVDASNDTSTGGDDATYPDSAIGDAGSDTLDAVVAPDAKALCAAECGDAGGACAADGTCMFNCASYLACQNAILCPPNIPCDI